MRHLILSFLVLVLSGSHALPADNPYVKEGSIGTQPAEEADLQKGPSSFRHIQSWAGERFLFLPQPKTLRGFGYQDFGDRLERSGYQNGLPYEKYCGRIAKVLSVKKADFIGWDIILQMEDDQKRIAAWATSTGTLDKVAPVADLDDARAKWKGKVLWYARTKLTTYNEEKDQFGEIAIKKHWPVRVKDIVAGWYNHEPIRFIVRTPSLTEGYADVCWSGTNWEQNGRDFESVFLQDDPRKAHDWGRKVWFAIEDEKVFVGMTEEQALMSWGKPMRNNRTVSSSGTNEQWVYYGAKYLHLRNGVVTSISE